MAEPFDHILDYADDYFHDALTPEQDAYVEKHCERCRICKTALEEAEKRYEALSLLAASEAPSELVASTLEKIDAHQAKKVVRWRRIRRGTLIGAAALVGILGIVHLYFLNLSPSPFDLRVYGQTQLFAGAPASLRVHVRNHVAGMGLKDVPVTIELVGNNKAVQLANFRTDAHGSGTPRFRWPDWNNGEYELRITAQPGGSTHAIARKVKLKRSAKMMLSSDRPVYQPGQMVHLRALALQSQNLHPVAKRAAVFTIRDPKGNMIFKQKETTSKFGICAADCLLADEIIEGSYTIACELGDTTSRLMVQVKKYVLPKFKVEIEPDRKYYQPEQRVRGKVTAAYFFGKPVAGGDVEMVMVSNEEKPKVNETINIKTDEKGEATFEFPPLSKTLIGKEPNNGAAWIRLRATITDTAGQKHAKTVSRIVAAQQLRIEVIPEAGQLVRDVPNIIYLFVTRADGTPVKAKVEVTGLPKPLTTSDMGVTSFSITPGGDEIDWTIRATANNERAERNVKLHWGRFSNDFIVRPDKAVYRGGDTMRLIALGEGAEPVFVDLLKGGQTILTATVALTNGRGELKLDLPPELSGTLQLCAYRFGNYGLPVRKSRVLYVRPADQLQIKTALDKQEYRPGSKARLQLAMTAKDGKPVPGALSLAAVDEAVFHVLEQRPGLEQAFYTLEEELLRPVYALYAWSPNVVSNKRDDADFERVVFANSAVTEVNRLVQIPKSRLEWFGFDKDSTPEDHSYLHRLSDSTFPGNKERTDRTRDAMLGLIVLLWAIVILVTAITLYLLLWHYLSKTNVILIHAVAFLSLCAIVSPPFMGQHEWHTSIINRATGMKKDMSFSDVGNGLGRTGWRADTQREGLKQMTRALHSANDAHRPNTTLIHGNIHHGINVQNPPRIRHWFPETLLWEPQLITDDQGRAALDIDLADSITTWRLTTSGVTADGRLGAEQLAIKVFQPFFVDVNLPIALTRGDEVSMPVVLYNYLDKPQRVAVKLGRGDWFDLLDKADREIELQPREVRATHFRLRAKSVGVHQLQVSATTKKTPDPFFDAVRRRVEVVPDGRPIETVWNGSLAQPAKMDVALPANAVPDSGKLIVKIYPSSFSQLIEGLDGIFRMPYGCFEQTSSTTYPNVLALDYLKRTGKSMPAVEAKARQYIHLGYQRLLGFEVKGGGFDWFGRPPANRTLTAYGLMEFEDMAKVHHVDPALITRTRKWLLDQRKADGSWQPEGHAPQNLPAGGMQGDALARVSTTAYIAWAVYRGQSETTAAKATREFLVRHRPADISDPHLLALMANALLAIDRQGDDAQSYLNRLVELKRTSDDGKTVWWQQPSGRRTTFYGAGRCSNVETTALAALALMQAKYAPATTNSALAWLTQQRDGNGTWHSTQATVLALKTLLAGTDARGGNGERRIEVVWNNGQKKHITIPADQAEVMKQINLSHLLDAGRHQLSIRETTHTAAGYQVLFRCHVPEERPKADAPLSIDINYTRDSVKVDELLKATATITNHMKVAAPMVIVDLPIPPGFAVSSEDFRRMIDGKMIAKYQIQPRRVLIYLRDLNGGKALELPYHLRATMPVRVSVPAPRVYEYYNPQRQGVGQPARLTAG